MTSIDLAAIPTRKLVTAIWNLSASGSGTVTYHQFRIPGASEAVWPEALPGAICTRRERGGTFRAAERHASSEYRYDAHRRLSRERQDPRHYHHRLGILSTTAAGTAIPTPATHRTPS